jgi:selenocysteine lyase/cysteine desulfurase
MVASFGGVSPEEIVITRNTTESLNTIILGYPWEKGDEAIINVQDYPNMLEAFYMASKRYGMVNKYVDLPLHPKNDEEIVNIYESAITSKTRVILITHMINISGQILPVKKICDMAHSHGVEVIVDGAHTFAHLDFKIPDLGGDYYGASLHKWLCCPLGLGLMYIKKDKISKIWPLMGDTTASVESIDKFERTGTLPLSSHRTIANALKFHNSIGSSRKQERLHYLKDYWTSRVKDIPGVTLNTPLTKDRSCAIANIALEGYKPNELSKALMEKYRIFTVAINNEVVKGVRVTPHLYTTINDLDLMVKAIGELART